VNLLLLAHVNPAACIEFPGARTCRLAVVRDVPSAEKRGGHVLALAIIFEPYIGRFMLHCNINIATHKYLKTRVNCRRAAAARLGLIWLWALA
jgi:hypothetical protein